MPFSSFTFKEIITTCQAQCCTPCSDGPNPVGFQSNKTGKAIKTQTQRKKMTNACRGDGTAFLSFAIPCVAHRGVFVPGS